MTREMNRNVLELLAPARDADTAKAAILAGADSVYIGASRFGARAAAGNSTDDIADLCRFAHVYGCKVYITLNTILSDAELPEAAALLDELYGAGADAAIVQDMGLFEKTRSPIPFHASTQCHLTTPQKARFLNACGFDTLVLARELSLAEIARISAAVDNRLECFVHGALCVSYSGQCYLSQAIGGRSGNRGVCAQPCRMKWSFCDSNGEKISAAAHFLSLRDMNRSASLAEMIQAGISVFKIEGRLKDANYVKNTTAFYRKKLDEFIAENPQYTRASFGISKTDFTPAPQKTFSRAFTEYHLHGISAGNESFRTPKARGELLGRIKSGFAGGFVFADAEMTFSNGDGIFLVGKEKTFGGNVYKIDGEKVFVGTPAEKTVPENGAEIWRNKDAKFERELGRKISRKLKCSTRVSEDSDAWTVQMRLADSRAVSASARISKSGAQTAQNLQIAAAALSRALAKLGDTPFEAEVEISAQTLPFLPPARANEIRRVLAKKLEEAILEFEEKTRLSKTRRAPKKIEFKTAPFSADKFANVFNESAKLFYKKAGFEISEYAPEAAESLEGERVMTTRHCVLRELGMCKKTNPPNGFKEPFYLANGRTKLRLKFDCSRCGMDIFFERPQK